MGARTWRSIIIEALQHGTGVVENVFCCTWLSKPRSEKLSSALLDLRVGQRAMAVATANSFPADMKIFSVGLIPNLSLPPNHIFILILVSVLTVILSVDSRLQVRLGHVARSRSLLGYSSGLES